MDFQERSLSMKMIFGMFFFLVLCIGFLTSCSDGIYSQKSTIRQLEISSDDRFIASSDNWGEVIVYDRHQKQILFQQSIDQQLIDHLIWLPDTQQLLIFVGRERADGDPQNGKPRSYFSSPDIKPAIYLFDPTSKAVKRSPRYHHIERFLLANKGIVFVSPSGSLGYLNCTGEGEFTAHRFDYENVFERSSMSINKDGILHVFAADKQYIFRLQEGEWKFVSGEKTLIPQGHIPLLHDKALYSIRVREDGLTDIYCDHQSVHQLWNDASIQIVRVIPNPQDRSEWYLFLSTNEMFPTKRLAQILIHPDGSVTSRMEQISSSTSILTFTGMGKTMIVGYDNGTVEEIESPFLD